MGSLGRERSSQDWMLCSITEAAAWIDCNVRFQRDGVEKWISQVCSAWTQAGGEEGMALRQGGGSCRNRQGNESLSLQS